MQQKWHVGRRIAKRRTNRIGAIHAKPWNAGSNIKTEAETASLFKSLASVEALRSLQLLRLCVSCGRFTV